MHMKARLSNDEVNALRHFLTQHGACRLTRDESNGHISIELSNDNGIGVAIKAKCWPCAAEEDLTDLSTW